MKKESISAAKSHFEQIPWCAALLHQPGTVAFLPSFRLAEDAPFGTIPTQDQLFSRILHAKDAIPECIGFYRDPFPSDAGPGPQTAIASGGKPGSRLLLDSSTLIFDLQPGVNGFNGLVHGGLVATLMDEAVGNFLLLDSDLQLRAKARVELSPEIFDLGTVEALVTARMNVKFKRPIATPQSVVVSVSVRGIDGRKLTLDVTVKGENAVEYASCEALWVSIPKVAPPKRVDGVREKL